MRTPRWSKREAGETRHSLCSSWPAFAWGRGTGVDANIDTIGTKRIAAGQRHGLQFHGCRRRPLRDQETVGPGAAIAPRLVLLATRLFQALALCVALLAAGEVAAAPLKVVGRFLQDAHGNDIMMRGVNLPVYKSGYSGELPPPSDRSAFNAVAAAIDSTKANVVRLVWLANPPDNTVYTIENLDLAIEKYYNLGIIPVVMLHDLTFNYDLPDEVNNDPLIFKNTITAFWTRPDVVAVMKKHQDHLVINIANEWGSSLYNGDPATAAAAADNFIQNYKDSIKKIRDAGIIAPLMVDAPKGLEYKFLLDHGQALLDADPQHNTLLSAHAYWAPPSDYYPDGFTDESVIKILDDIKNSGLPIVLGEVSSNAYSTIQCDPVHYVNLLTRANKNQIGYLYWAWYEDGTCGHDMNITGDPNGDPLGDGVTLPTAASPYGYDALYHPAIGISAPALATRRADFSVLNAPALLNTNFPYDVKSTVDDVTRPATALVTRLNNFGAEKRPVVVLMPGWDDGMFDVPAARDAQAVMFANEGYVALNVGFHRTTDTWNSDLAESVKAALDKLCLEAYADCSAVVLAGASYGGMQIHPVVRYLRAGGAYDGSNPERKVLGILGQDSGYALYWADPANADAEAYSIAMIQNQGDAEFRFDACDDSGNCGARNRADYHQKAPGSKFVLSYCPAGGTHGAHGNDWDAWVLSAVKTMLHNQRGVLPFTGYVAPPLVSNACVSAPLPVAASVVPGAPTIGVASAGNASASASVGFTPPASDGGAAIDNYRATCGSTAVTGLSSPIIVTGLANGVSTTCTVAVHNAVGWSPESAASNGVTPAKTGQSISFGGAPAVVVGSAGTLSATATSGLAVTFSSTTDAVCTVSGSTVSGISAGTCTIAANQAGDANYAAAAQVTQEIILAVVPPPALALVNLGFDYEVTSTNDGVTRPGARAVVTRLNNFGTAKRPVVVLMPGWGGTGDVPAAQNDAQAQLFANQGYVALNIGFHQTSDLWYGDPAEWYSDLAESAKAALDKLCVEAYADCSAVVLTGDSYGGTQIHPVVRYLRAGGAYDGTNPERKVVGILGQDSGYSQSWEAPIDADATVYSIAMIENLGDTTFPVDSCAWGNCGARNRADYHQSAPGSQYVLSYCPAGGAHGTHGNDWDAWVLSAVKTMLHTQRRVPKFTGYVEPSLAVSNACLSAPLSAQTISFGTAPAVLVDDIGTVSASATSGGAIIFSSTTPGVCTISGSTVTGVSAGTCTIAANQAGNDNYAAATQVTQNITVSQLTQGLNASFDYNVISTVDDVVRPATALVTRLNNFGAEKRPVVVLMPGWGDGTGDVAAARDAQSQMFANQGYVALNIGFHQTGDAWYSDLPESAKAALDRLCTENYADCSAVVLAGESYSGSQTHPVIRYLRAIGTFDGSAGANAGRKVVGILGQDSGYTYYWDVAAGKDADATQYSIAMIERLNDREFPADACTWGNCGVRNRADYHQSAPGSQYVLSYCPAGGAHDARGYADWDAWVLSAVKTMLHNQRGVPKFTGYVEPSLAVSNACLTPPLSVQTISFGSAPAVVVGGSGTVSATATSGGAVTFSSKTTGVCTISGSTVNGVSAGTCTIAADQAGNASYAAATQVTQSFSVGRGSQIISFGAAPVLVVGGTETESASGGASDNSVVFSSATPSVCTVSGSSVTGVAAGTCSIVASQAGSGNYAAAAQVTQNINIGQGRQSIGAISFTPTSVGVGGSATVSALATSGLGVTFGSMTAATCSVSGNSVIGVSAGICTIAANQAGNTNYAAAPQVTQSISVDQGSQSIGAIGFTPTSVVVGGSTTVSATATSGLGVTFGSTTAAVCSVSGNSVIAVGAGTCTIAANQAGNTNYAAAPQVTQSINIGQGSQTISFGAVPAIAVNGTGTVNASGGASGNPVIFSSTTPGVCTVSGSTITGITVGTCAIAANQAGNANYAAAGQVTQNINVAQGSLVSQSIGAISFNPNSLSVRSTTAVSAIATSGLGVTFSSTTTGVCTVSGSTVTGVAVGTCTVVANQAGNANYSSAAQLAQDISVGQGSQSIGTISLTPTSLGIGGSATVSATATSGLGVTFSSTTPGVCSASGNTVIGLGAGTCTIAANQAGNNNYSAAPQVTQSIAIGQASQSISLGAAPTIVVGGTGTVSASGGASGNAVSFTSTTPGVCTVSGGTITGVSAGTCIIAANQAGNSNYAAAAQVTQNISVGQGNQSIGAIGFTPTNLVVGGSTTASATASSGLPVRFSTATTNVCSVSGSTIIGVSAGTCVISASQAGNTNYAAATQVTQSITVGHAGTTTSTTSTTTSTIATTTTTTQAVGPVLNLAQGWNLVGNGSDTPINVATTFADTNSFVTIWKWIAAQSAWAFHAPSLAAQGGTTLTDYVASKGYQLLTTITGGEGFWVNAKQAGSVSVANGNAMTIATLEPTLVKGWNLSSIGETATPKQFCDAQSTGVTTLWAWDATNSAWYFYAPALDADGSLGSYIASKGYLDFSTTGKTLGPGVGFWVNKP